MQLSGNRNLQGGRSPWITDAADTMYADPLRKHRVAIAIVAGAKGADVPLADPAQQIGEDEAVGRRPATLIQVPRFFHPYRFS
jgi:hypothetical protein